MGVAGLWDVLKPAAKTRSLTELAVTEGFQANPGGLRGYRLGIDASIWFFHAEYGKEGENPVLRTLFFRCATLLKSPFLPLFVFDGPKRPDFKRGKRINKTGNKLIPGMKRIVEAFGFESRTAPGEAEAELAYLNRIGVIDGILSDDVDNFLFGAMTVIRNQSNNLSGNKSNPVLNSDGRDDKNHTRVFSSQSIHEHPDIQLTRGGMILIGLMSGGDYEGGLERCGIATSHALARCGFGDSLYEATRNLSRKDLVVFLDNWREELRYELKTNSQGFMARKALSLSKSLPDTFPNIDVLLSYVKPVTSESLGHDGANPQITWSKEPNVAALASACELFFEWGYKEAIIKRFRTVIWPGTVLRILRRAVLDVDTLPAAPSTPCKSHEKAVDDENGYGTPSKMIAKHFSSMNLNSEDTDSESYQQNPEESPLIVSISRERTHSSTDGLPEYRLEISPRQLVEMAVSGIQGLRQPEGPNEWASDENDEDDEDDGERGRGNKGKAKEPIDPHTHLRVWITTCMVDPVEKGLVRAFREIQDRKKQRKRAPRKKQTALTQTHESSPPSKQNQAEPKLVSRTSSTTPPRPDPRRLPSNIVAMREEEEQSSGDEGELPTWVITTEDKDKPFPRSALNNSSKLTEISAPQSISNPTIMTSKITQVAGLFEASIPPPSLQHVEIALALSESEDELPTNIYQTIQPHKLDRPTISTSMEGYLSLSDSSNDENLPVKLTSPSKRKKQIKESKIQTKISTYTNENHYKKTGTAECHNDANHTEQIRKSPRRSRNHASTRHAEALVHTKEQVITISDDDTPGGYTGISRPKIAPLQLARSRANRGGAVPTLPKPVVLEILELSDDEV